MMTYSRRRILQLSALATLGSLAGCAASRASSPQRRKKVLFLTKSAGFQHSVITRNADDPSKLAYAEQILTDLAAPHGYDVICSKDGSIFTPEMIANTDVFVFYTTGDLTKDSDKYEMKKDARGKATTVPTDKLLWREPAMPAGAKEAFMQAIFQGKGFVGFHSATDTFHSKYYVRHGGNLLRDVNDKGVDDFDPFVRMLGGEFVIHGKQQEATLRAIDPKFPGAGAFDKARFVEEWYSLKNFSPDLHVVLAQETEGMEGAMYKRAMFPQTWGRMHGKGRIFYTSLGHREDVWLRPDFRDLIVGALAWTSRRVDADVTANIAQVTPAANVTKSAKS